MDPIAIIRAAVPGPGQRQRVDWTQVTKAVTEVSQKEIVPDAETALATLLDPDTPILVTAAELPHLQSPADMVRTAAMEALWRMTGNKYEDLSVRLATASDSAIIRRLVINKFPTANLPSNRVATPPGKAPKR